MPLAQCHPLQLQAAGQGASLLACSGSGVRRPWSPMRQSRESSRAGPAAQRAKGWGQLLAPLALTAAAPQRAEEEEEEEERSRLHHQQNQQQSRAAAGAAFPSFPPSREPLLPAGVVSACPLPCPQPFLSSTGAAPTPPRHPQALHRFQPEGYFQREVSSSKVSSCTTPPLQPRAVLAAPDPGEPLARCRGSHCPHRAAQHSHPTPHDAARILSLP